MISDLARTRVSHLADVIHPRPATRVGRGRLVYAIRFKGVALASPVRDVERATRSAIMMLGFATTKAAYDMFRGPIRYPRRGRC
jgi:hypothetical protein